LSGKSPKTTFQEGSQHETTPIMRIFWAFKSESILPNTTPRNKWGKGPIWSSNRRVMGLWQGGRG